MMKNTHNLTLTLMMRNTHIFWSFMIINGEQIYMNKFQCTRISRNIQDINLTCSHISSLYISLQKSQDTQTYFNLSSCWWFRDTQQICSVCQASSHSVLSSCWWFRDTQQICSVCQASSHSVYTKFQFHKISFT